MNKKKPIKELLLQDSWNGEDVGRAWVSYMCSFYKTQLTGREPKLAISTEQLNIMKKYIAENDDDIEVCTAYLNAFNTIRLNMLRVETHFYRLQLTSHLLESSITTFTHENDLFEYFTEAPSIMTQKQYNAMPADMRNPFNGIAIIQVSEGNSLVDEQGYYRAPTRPTIATDSTLFDFTPGSEDYKENSSVMKNIIKEQGESIRFIVGHNMVVRLLSKQLGIPGLNIFIENGDMYRFIDAYNAYNKALFERIDTFPIGSLLEKEKKLTALRTFFPLIDTAAYQPSKQEEKEIRQLIKQPLAEDPGALDDALTFACGMPI